MTRLAATCAGVIATILLTSCAAVSLVDTWRSPAAPTRKYQKLLVASLAKETENRRVYEDILAEELARLGVDAVPSHAVTQRKGRNVRAQLEAARQAGAEAVLTVQTIRMERHTDIQPGYVSASREGFSTGWDTYGPFGPYDYGGFGYGYRGYGGTTWFEPPTVYSYDVATIQINLFDGASGKLLWAATMETLEPGRLVKVGKDLARTVTRELGKEGLI